MMKLRIKITIGKIVCHSQTVEAAMRVEDLA